MRKCFLIILVVFPFLFSYSQPNHLITFINGNDDLFNSIKNLTGEWKGTFKWINTQPSSGEMNARYYLTGNGTSVVEDLIEEGNVVMTSVYHLDGSDLRVTHFCAAGNQPRLKASSFKEEGKAIQFEFVDITNLTSPDAPHVKGLELKFPDKNHLIIIFIFTRSGTDSMEQIDLTRSK